MCFHSTVFEAISNHCVSDKLQNIEIRDYSSTENLKTWTISRSSGFYWRELRIIL